MFEENSNDILFHFFRSSLEKLSPNARKVYGRAVDSLERFIGAHALEAASLRAVDLSDWLMELLADGLSMATARQYLDAVGSLANSARDAGLEIASGPFAPMRLRVKEEDPKFDVRLAKTLTDRVVALMRRDSESLGDTLIWRDIALLSLLNGAMPLSRVAALNKDDASRLTPGSQSIIERHCSPRRKYIFDLRQSALTPRQLATEVNRKVATLFQTHLSHNSDLQISIADPLLRGVWVWLAMRLGVNTSLSVKYIGGGNSWLIPRWLLTDSELSDPSELSDLSVPSELSELSEVKSQVAASLLADPERWYALHLRRGITVDDLEATIAADTPSLRPLEIFSPVETITRRQGKRLVHETQPLISGIIFLRTRTSGLRPLMRAIGHQAWCYRLSNVTTAPYAVIPDAAMTRFRRAVAHLPSATSLTPLGTHTLRPGDTVEILGGILAGHHATIVSATSTGPSSPSSTPASTGTLYRLHITPTEGLEWYAPSVTSSITATLPGDLLKPLKP